MNKIEKQKQYQKQIYGNPNWINGRINRSEYFRRNFFLNLSQTASFYGFIFGIGLSIESKSFLGYILILVCGFLIPWTQWCILMNRIKRAHDLNWSGWTTFPFILFEIFLFVIGLISAEVPELIYISIFIYISYLIYCLMFLFKKGTQGINRYGKNPLEILSK